MALAITDFFDRVLQGPYQALVTHPTGIFRLGDVELEEGDSFDLFGVAMTSQKAAQLLMMFIGAVLKPRIAVAVGQTDEDGPR